jgi:hypothetical protein
MKSQKWTSIPLLPCVSIEQTVVFWEMLGFVRTYYQTRPYQYAVVRYQDTTIHFHRDKLLNPKTSGHFCLVMVPDAENVYRDFGVRMRASLGKFPNSGIPRVSRMKPGQTRFTMTDPSGNAIIFISEGVKDDLDYRKAENPDLSPLERSIAQAERFRDFKNDLPAALGVIESGLKNCEDVNTEIFQQAKRIRSELLTMIAADTNMNFML